MQLADVEASLETALGETAKLTVRTEPKLEPQFSSEYQTRSFPWALKYRAGGADFPNFARPAEEEGDRWRRAPGAAILTPHRNAKNLARRVELQIANDWNLVPAARGISARFQALQSSYATCTMNAPKSKPLPATATDLVQAVEALYRKLQQGSVKVDKKRRPIHGDFGSSAMPTGSASMSSYFSITTAASRSPSRVRRRCDVLELPFFGRVP